MRTPALTLAIFSLAGCATAPLAPCPAGGQERLLAEMFFGRNIGDRLGVSDEAFRRFVDAEVTPRFPDGFTVIDARGQYRDSDRNRIVREPSKMLAIVLSDEARDAPRLNEIADAYKTRFKQQSVGVITRRVCASF